MDINKLIELITKLVDLEKKIEIEIKKESDAKKRKKLQDALRRRDLDAVRKLLFDN